MIDFHAHVLPGLDHGSDNEDVTQWQLKEAYENGIDILVATSHFYPHRENVNSFLDRRKKAVERLETVERSVRIVLAAEVLLCPNMDRLEGLEQLCLQGTDVLLLEMPDEEQWEECLFDTIYNIKHKGIRVVIAHVDRYKYKNVKRLLECDVEVQLNADFVRTLSGRKIFRECLERECLVAMGSDIHGQKTGYKYFARYMKKYIGVAAEINDKTKALLENARVL